MTISSSSSGRVIIGDGGGILDCCCETSMPAGTSDCDLLYCAYQWDELQQLWIKITDDCADLPPYQAVVCLSGCQPPDFAAGCDGDTYQIKPCNDPGSSLTGWEPIGVGCP